MRRIRRVQKMLYVIAPKEEVAREWARDAKLKREHWKYVSSPLQLANLNPEAIVVRLLGYEKRQDAAQIDELMKKRNRVYG